MNKEIRDYQESMFWGLSFGSAFSALAILAALYLFPHPKYAGEQVTGWLCARRLLCSLQLFPLPRHDGRTVRMGSHQIRTAVPEMAGIQIREPVLSCIKESLGWVKDDGNGASFWRRSDETEETKEARRKG